jgi:hypothetical protein
MTLHVKYKIMAYSLEYCFSSLQPMYNFGHRQWDLKLLAHGRWFSLGTPASSTAKTGRHDIAESGIKIPKINQN